MAHSITLSNRLENLLIKLIEKLFSSDSFRQKTVVVASRGMKRWVKGKILASKGSFFGVHLITLGEFLQGSLPQIEELAVHLYGKLSDLPELKTYLEGKGREEREVALAVHLSSLFLSYYDLGFSPPKNEWQEKLFASCPALRPLTTPKGELFFFGFSHLPKPLLDAFEKEPLDAFFLVPTLHYWEDLRKNEHPLLGNLGRMGRVMARFIGQDQDETRIFSLPEEISEHPAYVTTGEEFFEDGPLTLLKALQVDLLLMRNDGKVELSQDDTIEVHVAASKEREVEILKDRLLLLMGQEGISPGEILVMAKNIAPYLPLLKAHFEQDDLPFKVTYQEAGLGASSQAWTLLKDLLTLKERRFRSTEVEAFFSADPVQTALHLSKEDLEGLKTIIREGAIFWGWDLEERERDILLEPRASTTPIGSWQEGFERILNGVLSFQEAFIPLDDPLPLSFIEMLDAWKERLETLRRLIYRKEKQSIKAWSLWLGQIIDTYLGKEGSFFDELLSSLAIDDETEIPFPLFYTLLEKGVQAIEATPGASEWDAISFTSLGPMRAVPKRVIWLLGMEEESFPSKEPASFGDLAACHPDKISGRDGDRFAFLETILSARERLILSYSTPLLVAPAEGEASPVLQELITTLDSHFLIDGKSFTETHIHLHPRSRFEEPVLVSKTDYALLMPPERTPLPEKTLSFSSQEVKIKELLIFAKDPAQTFFRAHFETSLPWFESKLPTDEPFALSKGLLREIDRFRIPPSLGVSFEGKALTNGKAYLAERERAIAAKKTFRVFFERDCKAALQDEKGNYILPPLKIKEFSLVGPLGLLSEEGLLVEGKEGDAYPLLLVSQLLPFKVAPVLHFLDSGKALPISVENPEEQLGEFLRLYSEGRRVRPHVAAENLTRYGALLP